MKTKKINKSTSTSTSRLSETILPVRCKLAFSELCRAQSKIYPPNKGPKLSSARFLKMTAIEKLIDIGIDQRFIDSIT